MMILRNYAMNTSNGGDSMVQRVAEDTAKYEIDIEGAFKPWDKDTITTEEIAALGGWDPSVGVILVNEDNTERTLQPGEVVKLEPGMSFAKKVMFKRG